MDTNQSEITFLNREDVQDALAANNMEEFYRLANKYGNVGALTR